MRWEICRLKKIEMQKSAIPGWSQIGVDTHVSSVRGGTSELVKNERQGKRTSCDSTKTGCFSMFGAQEWLKNLPRLPHL